MSERFILTRDLRARRMERGLTAAEVAHATGVAVWHVLARERGSALPPKLRARLAACLLAHRIATEGAGERKG
ncbi:MAG: helix-turn-helix transcriptional regulator [Bacillota bacterium]